VPTKQPFWDRPGVLTDKALVEASLNSPHNRALLIASCGLKLDDEAVKVVVGLRLWLDLCVPHECPCGSRVDAYRVHSFVCERSPGKTIRHHVLNDLSARPFSSSGVPITKKPSGLFRSDGNRPDGLTLVSWSSEKALCWDVTVTCPLAESYINTAAREPGTAAELATSRKVLATFQCHARSSAGVNVALCTP